MSLTVQTGFWQNKVLADTRHKLAQLYLQNPQVAESEKKVILSFWEEFEGLPQVLDGKLSEFTSWFLSVTSPETITRCLRALKEDGTIVLTSERKKQRQESQNEWRQYWGMQRRLRKDRQ